MNVDKAYAEQKSSGVYTLIHDKYSDPGTQYAFQILDGTILAGQDLKLQAFRHVQDLARAESHQSDFPYVYDLDYCRAILGFASLCPEPSSGVPMPLTLWQKALLCWSQGWRSHSDERRFHRVIFSVARTNGKTYLTVILLSYQFLVVANGYSNQDMAYIAPVSQQSKKGWRYVKTTFNRLANEGFGESMHKVKVGEDAVKSNVTQNQLLRLSDESGQFDSYHLGFAVHDESGDDSRIGLIRENDSKITSGQVQTYDSQAWNISTAYPDSTSSLYLDEKMMRGAMLHDDQRKLDDFLMVNYAQDSEEEAEDPSTWIKSNPILSLKGDQMLNKMMSDRDIAKEQGKLADFINKNLNMWLKIHENRFLNPHDIAAAVTTKRPISIQGRPVYIGIDLSKLSDDTAVSFVFPYLRSNVAHYWIEQHSWIPLNHTSGNIALKEKQDGINYRQAEQLGFADIAKNRWGYIDDDAVVTFIQEFIEQNKLDVKFILYDPWSASPVLDMLTQINLWPMMPVKQTSAVLDRPTHEFERLMREGRIEYPDDPIIQYGLTNAVLVGSSAGVKVDKERYTSKIDVVDSIINAMSRATYQYSDVDPDFDPNAKKKSPLAGMSAEEKHRILMNASF